MGNELMASLALNWHIADSPEDYQGDGVHAIRYFGNARCFMSAKVAMTNQLASLVPETWTRKVFRDASPNARSEIASALHTTQPQSREE